jgi:hypothetical protein
MNQDTEALSLQVKETKESLDKLVRRVDGLQKSVDLVYADREILEDIQGSISALKEILVSHKSHVDTATKDVKAEVIERSGELDTNINNLTEKVIDTIDGMLSKKQDSLPNKKSFLDKLFRR